MKLMVHYEAGSNKFSVFGRPTNGGRAIWAPFQLTKALESEFGLDQALVRSLLLGILFEDDPATSRDMLAEAGIELCDEHFEDKQLDTVPVDPKTRKLASAQANNAQADGIPSASTAKKRKIAAKSSNTGVKKNKSQNNDWMPSVRSFTTKLESSELEELATAATIAEKKTYNTASSRTSKSSRKSLAGTLKKVTTTAAATEVPNDAVNRPSLDGTASPNSSTTFTGTEDEKSGKMGEYFVFKLLENHAGPTFGFLNWTSELRHQIVEEFGEWQREEPDKEYADFTYTDTSHDLTYWLREQGVPGALDWFVERPTYHIEVKSTSGPCDLSFHMSKLQMKEARRMSSKERAEGENGALDIYLLFRVYNLARAADTRFEIKADPWRLLTEEELDVRGWILSLK